MSSALVLTAGLGTRLDPITRLAAKAAVPLGDRTLVEHILAWLHGEGVREGVLNLHHRPETIAAAVGDGAHLGLRVRYSWEQPILGSAGGPRHALPLLDADPLLIVNGDTLCALPLAPMREAHARTGADVTMALVPNPAPDHYNGVVLDGDRRVTGFAPRGQAQGTWHFIGIQIAARSVFADLPDGEPAETVAGIYRDAIARGRPAIFGYPVDLPFLDVGTPADYLAAALARGGARAAAAGAVDATARVIRSVVWPDAHVGAGAVLDECIVAGGRVPAGLRASRAVIVPAEVVRPGDRATVVEGVGIFGM